MGHCHHVDLGRNRTLAVRADHLPVRPSSYVGTSQVTSLACHVGQSDSEKLQKQFILRDLVDPVTICFVVQCQRDK